MKNTLSMQARCLLVLLLACTHNFVFAQSNPGGVSGAAVWLKADKGLVASGSNITSWTNQTGGTNFTGTRNPQFSANQVNFQPGVLFNGNNSLTSNATLLSNNGAYTKFVVFKYDGATANNLISAATGGTHAIYGANTSTDLVIHHAGNILTASNVVNTSRYFMATAGFSSGAANGTYINVDGGLKKNMTSSAPYIASNITLGAYGNGNYLTGRIAEAIVYPIALATGSNATRQIQSYLGLKYGIELAHNYLSSDATVIYDISSFAKNIAGLGRDDNSSLYQKQSISINGGNQVIMSLGNIAATNATNAGTIAADKQFLVWGDNNGALNATTALTGWTNTTTRLNRIWKLQNTGSFGQPVTVYFPVAALTSLPGNNPYLIFNTSNTLAGGGTEVASSGTTTIDGVAYNTYQVSFPTTGILYFSFASKAVNPGNVAGALVWVKTDAGLITSGNNVTGWINQMNAANSFTGAGNPQLSPANVNFNTGILFGGNSLTSSGNTLTGNSPYTKFVVFKYESTNTNNIVSSLTGNALFGSNTTTDVILWHSGNILNAANSVNTTRYFMATGGFTRSLTGGTYINVDGVSKITGTSAAAYVSSPTQLGAYNNGAYLNGRIAEVIIFPTSLGVNTADTRKVESYLGLKYGITVGHDYLASDGTTVTYATTGFASNIAGIGRDDNTALYQKQSRSINPNIPQVLMAVNGYSASNQLNNATIASDNQFLIWGDNNGSLTSTSATTGWTITNTRLNRIWKLQNTNGFNQEVTVYFPVSTLNYLPGTNPYLVCNTSATLTGGGMEVAASSTVTIDGVLCKGFKVTFPTSGTQYFSFASKAVNPGNVAGAAVWLRPDAGLVASGSNITNWVNQVNAANSFTATANPQLFPGNINFHPGVVFNSGNYLTSSGTVLPANTAYTKFVVFKYDGAANTNNIISAGTGNSAFYGNNTNTDLQLFHNGPILNAAGVVNNTRYFLATGGFTSGAANGTFIGVDGTSRAQGTSSAPHTASTLQLGAYGNNSFLNGRIAEVIVYPSALGNNTVASKKIQSYLGIKYGISIGHDYIASDGTTTTYSVTSHNNNIAGLGRDDDEGLHQVQGIYALPDQQAFMSIGPAQVSHADNLNTIASDKQFLIWGHDNGSLTTTSIVTGYPTVNQRLNRVWKLQNTGNFNQEVNVYFPVAQLNLLTNTTKYLIYNTSNTLAGPGTEVAASGTFVINATQYAVFKVTFPTTGVLYFSFASKAVFPGAVSGAAVWLRGDAGVNTTTGTTVGSWVNQSNTANSFAATGNIQLSPSLVNYNPSMLFDGASYLTSAANVTTSNTANYTKFVVFRSSPGAGGRNLLSGATGLPAAAMYTDIDALKLLHNGVLQVNTGSGTLNPGREYIGTQVFNNGVSNGTLLRINGVTGAAATISTVHGVDKLQIGAYGNSNFLLAGSNIAEAVMYNTALTATDYYKVESYLALKYGITIGYDYRATSGTTIYGVAGYANHIAGIGRDDNTGLVQRQSKSVDGGNQVIMALEEAAVSNDANTNTFNTDLQFLVWGDNDGAGFNYNAGVSQKRLKRTWKLQNTGSFSQGVTVYYPATGLNGLGSDPVLIMGSLASLDDGSAGRVANNGVVQINGEPYYSYRLTFPVSGIQYFSFAGSIVPEICGNGIDDDLDGYVDDLDSDCSPIPGCTTTAPPLTNFSVAQEWMSTSTNALAASVSPTVADLDGDGIPEVLTVRSGGLGITVFKGNGSNAGKNSVDYNIALPVRVTQSTMQPAVADIDRDGVPEVIVVGNDAYVYVFNNVSGNTTTYKFKSVDTVTTKFRNASPRIADIDEDGVPEIVVGLDVFQFNFRDGRLVKAVTGSGNLPSGFGFRAIGTEWGCDMAVIDIMPNYPGKEIVAGSQVYSVNLAAGTLSPVANASTISGGAIPANNDGPTAVADLDADGKLDIVYVNGTNIIIWDPVTPSIKLNLAYVNNGSLARGMPTIANVYNEKVLNGKATDLPEVLFNVDNAMHAYNLNKLTGPVWSLTTADNSGETGVTAFDLNGDGILEIIYNDEQLIRVINGNTASPANIATFASGTATWMEHPVVVDVDNDGSAEFVCVSGTASSLAGNLRVFGATTGTTPWQNTRKLWNGRGYRSKAINDDLSVPVQEQNILLQFPAGSGKYPLNIYNAQIDNRVLDPGIISASDLTLSGINMPASETSCEFAPAAAKLAFNISNNGSAAAPAGTSFRFYLGDPRKAGAIRLPATRSLAADLPVGVSVKDTVVLNLSAYTAPYRIYIVTNDDGSATIPFTLPIATAISKECDYNNNVDSLIVNPAPADFGNLSATWPAANASIHTVDAVWLGTNQPNAECAVNENDNTDGLVMTSGSSNGNGTKGSPWIVKGIDTECKFTITVNGNGSPKPVYWAAWYDADGNGIFTDALDLFVTGNLTHGSPVSTNFSFVVPAALGATSGALRIVATAENPGFIKEMNGTGNFVNGEVEDYFIIYAFPLPITLKDFTATPNANCSVQLKWNTSMEANSSHFDVQLYDGKEFVTIATMPSSNIATGSNYGFTHNIAQEGDLNYRLKHYDIDGKFQFSRVVTTKSVCSNSAIRLLPNPVVETGVISGLKAGDRILIYNAEGQLVNEATASGYSYPINMKKYAAGMYMAQIIRNGTMINTIKVVKM